MRGRGDNVVAKPLCSRATTFRCPRKIPSVRQALGVAHPRSSTLPVSKTPIVGQGADLCHRVAGSDEDIMQRLRAESAGSCNAHSHSRSLSVGGKGAKALCTPGEMEGHLDVVDVENPETTIGATPLTFSGREGLSDMEQAPLDTNANPEKGVQGLWRGGSMVENIAETFGLSPRVQGLLLLNVMTVIMATNWVVIKESEEAMDPFTFSALRFSIAAMALFPFIQSAAQKSENFKAGLEIGLWSGLGYILQAVGLMSTDASRASFLSTFTVILVPILAGIAGKQISKATWAAGAVALVGTFMLESGGAKPSIGDLYNLMSAAFFAMQIFRTEHYCRELRPSALMPMLATSVAATAAIGGVLAAATHRSEVVSAMQSLADSVAATAAMGGVLASATDPTDVVSAMRSLLTPASGTPAFHIPMKELLYTGLLSTDLVLLIEMVALHDVPSTDAAIIYTMEPVLGAVLAYFMLGERWGPLGWVGAGLILASSLAIQLFGGEAKTSPSKPEHAPPPN